MRKKTKYYFTLGFFFVLYLGFINLILVNTSFDFLKSFQIIFGFILLIFVIYFFILPEKMMIGGLESNLIFLDKVFFYDKQNKKQKNFFIKNNNIIIARILIFLTLIILKRDQNFLKLCFISLSANYIFGITLKLLDYFKIKKNLVIKKIPLFIQKNVLYKFLLYSLIVGINIGIGCGLILTHNFATGGSDIIFIYIHQITDIPFAYICLIIDGSMIVISFLLDYKRQKNKKNDLIQKYFFSFLSFIIAIILIWCII